MELNYVLLLNTSSNEHPQEPETSPVFPVCCVFSSFQHQKYRKQQVQEEILLLRHKRDQRSDR